MQPLPEHFSVILVGSWNVGLFTPTWTQENLFEGNAPELQFAFMPSGATTRQCQNGVYLSPSSSKMFVGVTNNPLENWKRAVTLASSIVTILTHTPINALGINFGFRIRDNDRMRLLFDLADLSWLAAAGSDISSTEIKHTLALESNRVLNLTLTQEHDASYTIQANFHFEISNNEMAPALLQSSLDNNIYDQLIALLKHAYQLELDEPIETETSDDSQ